MAIYNNNRHPVSLHKRFQQGGSVTSQFLHLHMGMCPLSFGKLENSKRCEKL